MAQMKNMMNSGRLISPQAKQHLGSHHANPGDYSVEPHKDGDGTNERFGS
jgi:hypothetical protein